MHPELFRRQYDFELDQRNGLTSAASIPLVAITAVASATSVILVDYRYGADPFTYTFCALALTTFCAVSYSVYSLFRSFWNYEYQKLPRSTDLLTHIGELHVWHVSKGSTPMDVQTLVDADFDDYLLQRIADATDWNGQNNVVRGNRLHQATAAIALGVACLLPTALMFAHNKVTAGEKTYQVHIVDPVPTPIKEIVMSSSQNPPPSQPATAPAPAPAVKPVGPPNLVFKGNSDHAKPSVGPSLPKK